MSAATILDEGLEQSVLATMLIDPRARDVFSKGLSKEDFAGLSTRPLFDRFIDGPTITKLPFEAPTLGRNEWQEAIKHLKNYTFCRANALWADNIKLSAQRADLKKLDLLRAKPPRRFMTEDQDLAKHANAELIASLLTEHNLAYKVISADLAPLQLSFYRTNITTVGAHSGYGKSALVEQIALDVTDQGAWVLDINLELSKELRLTRYYQHFKGPSVGPAAVLVGSEELDIEALKEAQELLAFYTDEDGNKQDRQLRIVSNVVSLAEVMSHINAFVDDFEDANARRIKEGHLPMPPPIVVVDYLQKIQVPGISDPNERMHTVLDELYANVMRRGYAMLWVSQFVKDEVRGRTAVPNALPNEHNMEYGTRINHATHNALFLHEPLGAWTGTGAWRKRVINITKSRVGDKPPEPLEGAYDGTKLRLTLDPIVIDAIK